jgi:hypothetical protein
MTHTVTYRILDDPAERILAGDQFKLHSLGDEFWSPCELFIGHRLRDLSSSRADVRRVIAREPTNTETPPDARQT